MKIFFTTLGLTFLFVSTLLAQSQIIPIRETGSNTINLSEQTAEGFELEITINNLEAEIRNTPWGEFVYISLPSFAGRYLTIGEADLPAIHQLIDIPYQAQVSVELLNSETTTLSLSDYGIEERIMPYQGPIEKSEEALQNHLFRINEDYYNSPDFVQLPLIDFQEVGNLRGHRLGQVRIRPLSYSPKTGQLRIHTQMKVRIHFTAADYDLTRQIHQKYYSPYFAPVFRELIINYQNLQRGDLTRFPVHYVIIYHDQFASQLQPFIEWKKQKGFSITSTPISAIGNTTAAITTYIQNLYNSADPPSFVLLVGDNEQITSGNGQTGSHVTDLYYTTMTPGDFVSDIYIGRFSAQNISQLTPQLEKTLQYETYQIPQTAFLNHGCFVATDDTYNYQVAEGSHNYVINTHFIPNNLQYDKLYAITYNATGQDVLNALNNGRFILNYSGHGSTTSWAGPSVSQSMVNSSTNIGMYPFVISNACLTGSFQIGECFGETWLRKSNGGGLAFTGASNSTYWDEDDEWERRAYDGVFWENYYSLAAFIFRGNLAVLNAGYSRAQYYFEVYHLFGDPSLMLYWGEPSPMTVIHPGVIFIGSPVFDVTVSGEDSALVSLYMNGTNYGTALTNANGYAQIQLNPVPTTPGFMHLVITKFNRQPYIDSLQVIPASGPYLYCVKPVFIDSTGNNNGIPEAGETLTIQLELTNVGIAPAMGIQGTISTSDSLVQLLNTHAFMGNLNAGDTTISGNFQLSFSPDIPHLHSCQFNVHLEAEGGYSWDQPMFIRIRKGARIELGDSLIHFPNTFLNFTTTRMVNIMNTGPDTLWIHDIESSLPQFVADPLSCRIAPGENRDISISFTPDSTLTYNGLLTFTNSDPINFITSLNVSGTGVHTPNIAVNPDSVTYTLHVTDSAVVPIIIINEGLGDLIYNAQITGLPAGKRNPEGSGGSDTFGHLWIDSDEPGGPLFQWIDISQSGTQISLTGNNSISEKKYLGFDFPFYGETYPQFRVCTNGWISFTTYSVAYNNVALPNTLAPRSLVAPLWDDLEFSGDSKVYFQNLGNKVVIQFENVYRFGGGGPYNFEVILYDNGNILFQYLSLDSLQHDYTVGIQNHLADDGLTVAYNEIYLKDSLAVLISKHSWASISPVSGIIPGQSQDILDLKLKTHNFPTGDFWACIRIESNDPDDTLSYIPIHLTVDSIALNLSGLQSQIPAHFTLEQNWPNPFNPATTISYSIPRAAKVELAIFNILGQRVKTLVNARQDPAFYKVQWDGTNDLGIPVSSGVYIYKLRAGNQIAIKKLILLR
ncbi:MAG: hypothetical protein Kow0042_11540 [Calditrichia bacterium]